MTKFILKCNCGSTDFHYDSFDFICKRCGERIIETDAGSELLDEQDDYDPDIIPVDNSSKVEVSRELVVQAIEYVQTLLLINGDVNTDEENRELSSTISNLEEVLK